MAFYRSEIGSGGGGTETETTLWTNPSPSSSFTDQTVSLSDNYTNYKKIRFYYYGYSADDEYYVEYKKEAIDRWLYGAGTSNAFSDAGGIAFNWSRTNYVRMIRRTGQSVTNEFWIGTGRGAGGTSIAQNVGKPTQITGIN